MKKLLILSALLYSQVAAVAETTPNPNADAHGALPVETEKVTARVPIKDTAGVACLTDPSALEDIRKKKDQLDRKAQDLAARESELQARERAVEEQLKKLQDARDEIAQAQGIKKKENEEKVTKLVETFETMSPKAASQLLANVDESLAVAAMSRISTARLAKIMNLMEPGKSSRLSELLAGVARARRSPSSAASIDAAAATTKESAKGGDKDDGHNSNTSNDAKRANDGSGS